MTKHNKPLTFAFLVCTLIFSPFAHAREMNDLPVIKLRSLDKITARTLTFEAAVGSTLKFGSLYIKVQACRKAPPIEQPESAAFLQIWEMTQEGKSQWVYSGWMFSSSPGLSHMDHPIYDVWVLDCLESRTATKKTPRPSATIDGEKQEGEGEVSEDQAPSQPIINGMSPQKEKQASE